MALSIDQYLASSYEKVVNASRQPTNQWVENAFLREMEKTGMLEMITFGNTLEATLDYRRNPDAAFLATDLAPTGMTKTEVLTAASYDPAQISVPIVWARMDEVKNSSESQKVNLVKHLILNAQDTHDELVEQAMFATSTQGFVGLATLVPTSGQGSVGGIDSALETWWRNHADTYQSDGSDIEATFTQAWNTVSKGSGSALSPKIMISGSEPHALYESQLQPLVRFNDTKEGDVGFKVLAFKTGRYSFSQFGGSKVYFLNPKSLKVYGAKNNFRDLGPLIVLENGEGFKRTVYSALQSVVDNKSRLAVVDVA